MMRTKCTSSQFCECINCERSKNGIGPLKFGDPFGWQIYNLLSWTSGTDTYHCPEDIEIELKKLCREISDADLRGWIGKFRNEKGQWPHVSVKDDALQARFDKLIPACELCNHKNHKFPCEEWIADNNMCLCGYEQSTPRKV